MIRLAFVVVLLSTMHSVEAAEWFEALKRDGSETTLYKVLHAMPKGGDLHNHNTGSSTSEAWYDIALAQADNGFRYYTKVRINNCRDFVNNDFPYYLLFRNILESEYLSLSECEQGEYRRLDALSDTERNGWLNSIRLDEPGESRTEFFEAHWQRINALLLNPYVRAELLANNLKTLAAEGVIYAEPQVGVTGARLADGTELSGDEMVDIFRQRLARDDIQQAGIIARLQFVVLRFTPAAEEDLRLHYAIAVRNRDIVVGLNMAGREDDDRGHPARFLTSYRELRRLNDLPLSIHGGEVDEPNAHVRDTLLIGADRIGHGLNLISDPELMLQMRYGPYLVEINLISNLLLGYVVDYSQHPFPEYLRTGIPVALSTDDRGMWDSSMTDEFYVAVKEFNLSWQELINLSRNSLQYGFMEPSLKQRLLSEFDENIRKFERNMRRGGVAKLDELPETQAFICARYSICN